MKIKLTLLFIGAFIFSSQLYAQKPINDSLSYALAVQMSEIMKQGNFIEYVDFNEFNSAMEEVIQGKSQMTQEESRIILTTFMEKQYNEIKAKNLVASEAFLEKNKTQAGVVTLPSGLQYKIERKGNGTKPTVDDEVEVHYKGSLIDGRVFDSSYERGETAKFPLAKVIKGWTEGLQQVEIGGKILLFIPPQLAYGENSRQGSIIEANSALIFEVELISIAPKQAQELISPRPIAPPPAN